MAQLPPLRVPKKAPWMTRHKEPEKPREIPDGFPGATDLKNLVKQTSELQKVGILQTILVSLTDLSETAKLILSFLMIS